MGELESRLQRRCQDLIKKNGGFVIKTHADMYSRRGIPDLLCCIPVTESALKNMLDDGWLKEDKIGIFVGIETKRLGELNVYDDRRKAQEIVGKEIKNAGGIWFVTDDSDVVGAFLKMTKGEL